MKSGSLSSYRAAGAMGESFPDDDAPSQDKALHLHRLQISNFLRVEALTIDAQGRHVTISGKNTSGKTSTVEAIFQALRGSSAKDTPEPIHSGASKASVFLDLGEYRVERRWTEKSTSLIVTAADGSRIAKPQQLLDGLLGKYSLDPCAFLQRRPQDQVDDVLSLAGVQPPVDKVQKITGETHPPRAMESADAYLMRLGGDETGLFYIRRREANRMADQKRAALEEQRQVVDRLGGAVTNGKDESASSILALIDDRQKEADALREAKNAAEDANNERGRAAKLLAELRSTRGKLDGEIAQLAATLERKQAELNELDARISKGASVVMDLDAETAQADARVNELPDPAPQIATLKHNLKKIEEGNDQRRKRQLATDQLQRLAKEAEQADASHRELDETLAQLRDLRVHLLDGLDIGVNGLEVGQGELRLNGVSFRQASEAEKIRTACAIAMRQRPKLRLLRLDGAESLDRESRETVLRLAEEAGFQCIMTTVAESEQLRVEIVGGENLHESNGA